MLAQDPGPGGLAVSALTKRFGKTVAIDHLDFDISTGQILALLGPNGAGKTTTLMCLAGLIRPDAGLITWRGVQLGSNRGRQMALITETPEVYEMLTVWEHMVFVGRRRGRAPGDARPVRPQDSRGDIPRHRPVSIRS